MEKLSMCRVCLEEDIRLRSIVETHLQEMYESLVLMPFETKDRRPILACYLCCARLQNCYELRRHCIRSEELFTQMLSCDELEPVQLQGIDNKKRLTVHNVIHFSMGHVPQMSGDNVGVEALTCDDVKGEQSDLEDIHEDALEVNSVYDNIQSADSDDDPLIIVKEEHSADTSEPTPKKYEQTVQRNPEDLTSSNLKEHELVQDMFKELNKGTAAVKTPAKSPNKVKFTLSDNNKERSTSVSHSERVQYTCDTCQQCYSSKCKLERHIRLCSDVWKKDLSRENSTSSHTHTGQRPHQCHVCEKSFSCMSHLINHNRTHTGEKPYHCDICKKQFSLKRTLTLHMHTHTGEKPHHCDICKKQFSLKRTLTLHMRTHTGEKPHHCYTCKKQFSQKSTLTLHMRTHTGEKPYQCDICKKCFSDKSNLANHIRTHTGEKPYQCDICKKCYSYGSSLIKHFRTHPGKKPYHCDTCKKQFSQKSTLTLHMLTHTGGKPHQCDICKKCFSDRSNLAKHIRTHTCEKPHQCDICKKCFSYGSSLIKHIRTHPGKKPYHCDTCKKQFSQKSTLTLHMRTHTGEKPYQCDICKKCFSDRSYLANHIRTHTGEKPYQCDICKKCFSYRSNLIKHIRTQTCKKRVNQSSSRPALT